ncbi:MAG: DUF169 domain-containing protein [Chloroflexota bacterium]|nr:DUF169 domain-containing protein [Chloroflexota bacterium]
MTNWADLSEQLEGALGLANKPLAITFHDAASGVDRFQSNMPSPADDGRTGAVPAGCVFWMHAADSTFSTVAADHRNCSVGSVTHGFLELGDVLESGDVGALLESGWVTAEAAMGIPVVEDKPEEVVYGPLDESPSDPDVVFIRITGRQLMVLHDAFPTIRIEGKPQCHIVAIAKAGEMAASVGCQLSRVRTQMPNAEMTCAIPASQLEGLLERLSETAQADRAVAQYAADDMTRFA